MLFNEIVISIIVLLTLSLMRINVVISLIIAALVCGVIGHYGVDSTTAFQALEKTIKAFTGGLGGGAETAMNYAILGAFAVALSKSGVTDLLAYKVISHFGKRPSDRSVFWFKYIILFVLTAFAISSQNLIPIHIAFIPIVVPPLLGVMNQLNIASTAEMTKAMAIPVSGMIIGLLFAFFVSYRKPRTYVASVKEQSSADIEARVAKVKPFHIWLSIIAILATCSTQLATNSTIMGGLVGLTIFALGGVFRLKQSNDIFQDGLRLMAMIGFVMIAASGYANVVNSTGGVAELVEGLRGSIDSKGMAALAFGFSPLATMSIVGVAAALGDAGSPASDSTLGPTSGLNADGKHDHIWDSVVPTFIHFNIPLIIFGWIAAMTL